MRCVIFSIFLTSLLLSPPKAIAFGTVSVPGLQDREHEKITKLGLAGFDLSPQTMTSMAGAASGSLGAVGGPDDVSRGFLSLKIYHCDGADSLAVAGYAQDIDRARAQLEACRTHIIKNLAAAIKAADGLVDQRSVVVKETLPRVSTFWQPCAFVRSIVRNKCKVLNALGLALHASQDFYAHSNWTDVATPGEVNGENPPGLGKAGRAPWLDPRRTEPFPEGLISGCFDGMPESRHCKNADGSARAKHQFLNKDHGEIDEASGRIGAGKSARSRGNDNFRNAVMAAIEDTRDKWAYFEEQVLTTYGVARGRMIVCVVKRDNPNDCAAEVAKLSAPSTAAPEIKLQLLNPRMTGESVVRAQDLLRKHGHEIEADGVFGRGTVAAVKVFQRANGLSVDGRIGPETWSSLNRQL